MTKKKSDLDEYIDYIISVNYGCKCYYCNPPHIIFNVIHYMKTECDFIKKQIQDRKAYLKHLLTHKAFRDCLKDRIMVDLNKPLKSINYKYNVIDFHEFDIIILKDLMKQV